MKIIFKALTGFGKEREVFFTAHDLEKVQYAFLREKRILLADGQAVDGKYIQQISPDWIRTMNWNEQHTLTVHDMNEINSRGVSDEAYRLLAASKERVHYLLTNNREQDIGKNVPLPELKKPEQLRSGTIKSVAELMAAK
jgi:hypothetical protein